MGRQKGGLKETFDAEIIAEIERFIGPGAIDGLDFEAIETAARHKALGVAAHAVEQRINADTSDHAGAMVPCECGQPARYAGRHDKTFESVLGSLKLSRAYYHCAACGMGFCPRDRALGWQGGSLSPGVLRMVAQVGAVSGPLRPSADGRSSTMTPHRLRRAALQRTRRRSQRDPQDFYPGLLVVPARLAQS